MEKQKAIDESKTIYKFYQIPIREVIISFDGPFTKEQQELLEALMLSSKDPKNG